ncbi:hypothetical protein PGT21_015290 [Puccinia graminis f. sp. tritici]|uniref:Uncharacterized protein n=1 Tax=Puccinia graminis f. sp. tritici TaxID=56615 RepID=A0A5B0MMV1_PUCGR|nr:hypothetical protein PGT21_015290 [Puccinia graminis f. sp. tritici]
MAKYAADRVTQKLGTFLSRSSPSSAHRQPLHCLPTEQLSRPNRFSRLEYLDNGFFCRSTASIFVTDIEGPESTRLVSFRLLSPSVVTSCAKNLKRSQTNNDKNTCLPLGPEKYVSRLIHNPIELAVDTNHSTDRLSPSVGHQGRPGSVIALRLV